MREHIHWYLIVAMGGVELCRCLHELIVIRREHNGRRKVPGRHISPRRQRMIMALSVGLVAMGGMVHVLYYMERAMA